MAAKLLSLGLLVSHSPTRCGAHVKAEGINLESPSVVQYMMEKYDTEEPRPTWLTLTHL